MVLQLRDRILDAASEILERDGVEGLTTRDVAAAANVQTPTMYRMFGDKRGLLDAVAEHTLARYVATKAEAKPHRDPVRNLRIAWDSHIAFCLAHPAVFAIMNGPPSRAAAAGLDVLRARVARIARAGRLAVSEERAVALIHAAGTGVVQTMLAGHGDATLPTTALDAVLGAILNDAKPTAKADHTAHAVALRSQLDAIASLTPGERLLMSELLRKISG